MTLRTDNIGFGDLKLIQDTDVFCYGVDAVLLADFAARGASEFHEAVDLGTGNGIIPFILHHKNPQAHITGIDLNDHNVDLACRSAALNHLEESIEFRQMNVLDIDRCMERGKVQVVTCNPPYFPRGGGIVNDSSAKFIARHETSAVIDDFVSAAAYLLENRGHFFLIHRPSRLVDIMAACRKCRLEPKEMRLIAPREDEIPNMVLLHCIKGGGRELKLLSTLNVHGEGSSYSDEILRIYEKSENSENSAVK